jgi:predicted ester cyclase
VDNWDSPRFLSGFNTSAGFRFEGESTLPPQAGTPANYAGAGRTPLGCLRQLSLYCRAKINGFGKGVSMSKPFDENLAVARRFFNECWNEGAVDILTDIMDPEHVHHMANRDMPGPENVKKLIVALRTAFPDFHIDIDDEIVSNDKVVLRWTIRGTHRGDFYGQAPTGNKIEYTGIDILRFANGRIVELWNQMDAVGFNRQMER